MSRIVRWNPFREMVAMQSAMDRIFDETWRDARPYWTENNLPIDVQENEDAFTVVANIPGVNADDINVNLHDNILTISFETTQENDNQDENKRVLIQERVYGKFSRSFRLGQHVNAENVEAAYDNGVLTLTLPKSEEAKPRQITVKNGKTLPASSES